VHVSQLGEGHGIRWGSSKRIGKPPRIRTVNARQHHASKIVAFPTKLLTSYAPCPVDAGPLAQGASGAFKPRCLAQHDGSASSYAIAKTA
jgi:hypothetical protein